MEAPGVLLITERFTGAERPPLHRITHARTSSTTLTIASTYLVIQNADSFLLRTSQLG